MKVAKHNNSLETNSQGESKSFGIGDASVVIEILRNRLYENKIQTLVQEYICNARDAMREVGKGNKFKVTRPTQLSPTFKVRDFGPGITPDRMEKIFILYGASTKRGTNNQTGGFGIGAKSAWSYTDSFTVVTIVDGTRWTYVCHTGTNNQGSLDLVSTDKTDEPNGTEIQVGVKREDLNEFRHAIWRCIFFWSERPDLNDNELPAYVPGFMVSPNIETVNDRAIPDFLGFGYNDSVMAVIDGVPYPIRGKLLDKARQLHDFVNKDLKQAAILHFGNGIVEVSASRESIADSDMSVKALNRMGTEGSTLVAQLIKSEFAKVKSTAEWVDTYRRLVDYFELGTLAKYGDYRIEQGMIYSKNIDEIKLTLAHNLDKRKQYVVDRISKEEVKAGTYVKKGIALEMLDSLYVKTKEESAVIENKRLRAYFETKASNPRNSKMILLEAIGDDKETLEQVVADLGVKVFEDIAYPETPKTPKVKIEREKEEFCMHGFGGSRYVYTTLEKAAADGTTYLYVEMQDGSPKGFTAGQLSDLHYSVRRDGADLIVVGLAPRALKMIEGSENFKPLKDWIAEFKPEAGHINSVIMDQAKHTGMVQAIVDVKGIEDDFLVDMLKEYKAIIGGTRKTRDVPSILEKIVLETKEVKEFIEADKKLGKLINEKYPLVTEIGHYTKNKNEIAFYINAKYNK